MDDRERDCLTLVYAGDDRVFIPIEQLHRVQKYIGSDGEAPTLSKLGGRAWEQAKKRTRKAVREIAEDLVKLYAARQASPGFSFSADTPWQREMEDSFIYEDTPDQEQASSDVKSDMEKAVPMDRLICGDVGYGKTEVAIRAAFKAVQDGKQVAVLAPTTILAQQHLTTFTERLADYPVNIRMLSRFVPPREQKAVVAGLGKGEVNIVIGTHRLISGDIDFSDMGLLVVDEEQRFGVVHKERLKQLKTSVDVMTMTATPIPRTLHMSLVSARDHVPHHHPAQGPAARAHRGGAFQRGSDLRGDHAGGGPRRTGLLRPQQGPVHRGGRRVSPAPPAPGVIRRGPRADAGTGTREGNDRFSGP